MASRNNLRNAFFDRLQVNDLQIAKNLTVSDNAEVDLNGETWDYIIAGGGIAGLWSARKLSQKYPEKKILLISSGEPIDQTNFLQFYSPENGIPNGADGIQPIPALNALPMNLNSLVNPVVGDFHYKPLGGNVLLNGAELTLDKTYFPEDLHSFLDEIQSVINPVMQQPIDEINVGDGLDNFFRLFSNTVKSSLFKFGSNYEEYRTGNWIQQGNLYSGPRYDPYLLIKDSNGNKFENIHILENTYVHNLIIDSAGTCTGTVNLSNPRGFISNSRLNSNGSMILAGGYLGTTQILSNLKETIPRQLSSQLANVGINYTDGSFTVSNISNCRY